MIDSKAPNTNRMTSRLRKVVQLDLMHSVTHHRKMAIAMTFPSGYLTSVAAANGWASNCATYKMEPSHDSCLSTRWASSMMPKTEAYMRVDLSSCWNR